MKNPIIGAKKDLITWISDLDDLDVLSELMEFKEKNSNADVISEPQTEYQVKDDFDERFAKGLSMEESRARTKKFIESLPWKK